MNNQSLFLDVHAIQTLPPSNMNRDDTGAPKTAQYGGVRRARISSQSWKRAIRQYFNDHSGEANIGVRTLDIVRYVADKIQAIDSTIGDEEAMKLADAVLNQAGIKTKDQKAKALFFLGSDQAKRLAQAALDGNKDKKALQQILKKNPPVDIALFGRMVADDPSLNEDASCQVAHAISTHAVNSEFDFYTAVDDLAPEDNAGAGMLGTIEYNSSTLYRYADVAIHELLKQLGSKEAVIDALKLFIEAFVESLPSGKMNTFANQTLPQAVLVTVRRDRPVNLVSAFEEPIKSSHGYVNESINRLFQELKKTEKIVEKPVFTLYLTLADLSDESLSQLGTNEESLAKLIDDFADQLSALL